MFSCCFKRKKELKDNDCLTYNEIQYNDYFIINNEKSLKLEASNEELALLLFCQSFIHLSEIEHTELKQKNFTLELKRMQSPFPRAIMRIHIENQIIDITEKPFILGPTFITVSCNCIDSLRVSHEEFSAERGFRLVRGRYIGMETPYRWEHEYHYLKIIYFYRAF